MLDKLKKAISPLYRFDDEPGQESPSAEVNTPATPDTLATPVRKPIKSTIARPAINNEVKEQILAEVAKATPTVLTEFLELVQSMSELAMDDATRYKSAFITFSKTTKRGIDTLLDALEKRTEALDGAVDQFEVELKNAQKDVDFKRKQAAQLQTQAEELNEQINELKTKQSELLLEASQAEQEQSAQQGVFMATVNELRAQLSEQAEQLKTYLITPQSTSTITKTKKRS